MRRRYITHPRFQYSFTFSFVLGVLLILVLIGGGAIGTLSVLASQDFFPTEEKQLLVAGTKDLVSFVVFLGLPTILFFGLVGIYMSYKFVGPLYRLEGWLELHLLGQRPSSLKLRPGDELEPIAKILNRLLSSKRREG